MNPDAEVDPALKELDNSDAESAQDSALDIKEEQQMANPEVSKFACSKIYCVFRMN